MVKKRDVWPPLTPGTKTPPGISDESDMPRTDLRLE
jgi:hypothetical protein